MVSVKPKVPLKAKNKKDKKPVKIEKQNKKAKPQKPQPKLTPPSPKETKIVKQVKEEIKKEDVQKKKTKYVMPSASITDDLVNSCLSALLDVIVPNDRQKNKIFEDEKPIFAEIHCMKIQNTKGNIRFVLPHSTVASTGEVCLVTPDIKKGRKHDHEPTIDRWEEILRKEGVTGVKTILPVRQLKVEYDQFELKRRLLTQHDFIMVDTRVLNHVSHILGKMFFKKHNMLVPVRINEEKNLKKSIDLGLRTAILRLSEGETSTITIGHTAMPKEKLKENIIALVHQLQTKFPGGEANIRAISLKLPLSVSLPLYLTLRPSSTIKPPKLTQKRPKHYTVLEDELSTMPGKAVRVAPDGTVKLKNLKTTPKASKKEEKNVVDDEEEEELDDEDDSEELEESETNDE
ncbi:ribosomal L1 domain-containing protein 1-like [Spodoptera litura]|uniref:Ribosomal L1 domain-containing protein 1-like n=1 Tax=Spodoptera litura TaxID=69820 RepID=A0A9J7EHX5_SPOLT|nr:ribosomal L1 domain-containing protein 1-like [Spodoptera litura]